VDRYLSPWPLRDVIETPLDGDLDVNGWELGKALKLLLKGNAVVLEWLTSPIVYRGDPWFRDELLGFAEALADRAMIGRHYLHLGEHQRRVYLGDGSSVPLKKLFYALRPAAALRWLRLHPTKTVAPMNFPTLMAECEPPNDLSGVVNDLLARKAVTRELGAEPLPAAIARFVDSEFEQAKAEFGDPKPAASDEAQHSAEQLFRSVVRHYDRG